MIDHHSWSILLDILKVTHDERADSWLIMVRNKLWSHGPHRWLVMLQDTPGVFRLATRNL